MILGSFPSVKSRESAFFYGNPQNRFWRVISAVFDDETPADIESKKAFLHRHKIALYDVIYSCDIIGSSDTSIENVTPSDIRGIIENSKIKKIILNGKTAGKNFEKYQKAITDIPYAVLPSTSPANAGKTLDGLTEAWRNALL